jgi:hypothetical protein
MPIMHPIANLNGTSREKLIDTRLAAVRALRDAMKAMQELSPHMRDYLGNSGIEAWQADRNIHIARFSALDAMANDLIDEALSLQDHP